MTALVSRLIELAISIQQIPSPTFHEAKRALFVNQAFEAAGLQQVEIDSVGNVYGCLPGYDQSPSKAHPPLVVSAHLDTVFPHGTDLSLRRESGCIFGPGLGDNSLGVAALLGLTWRLKEHGLCLPGDLWLAANVGEEGLGNLCGMQALVRRFENRKTRREPGNPPSTPDRRSRPLAYIILEGMALGQIYVRGLGVRRYRINVKTAGGHSWIDYGAPSAIHEISALSTRIASLELPRNPRTTLNVGVISGGSSVNVIASKALLELDLRSEDSACLDNLIRQVEEIVHSSQRTGVQIEIDCIGVRPSGEISPEHRLVQKAQECLRELGLEPRLNIGSTDANLPLSLGLPAITIGLTTGGGAHTAREFINLPPIEKGLEQVVRLISRLWDE